MGDELNSCKKSLFEHLHLLIDDRAVLKAMYDIPREQFIPAEYKKKAYDDSPLPIGNNQTISQPYMVALMTSLLRLRETDKVLEVGTGSGYQAAILAKLVSNGHVVTVERFPFLACEARKSLSTLSVTNVDVRVSDFTLGCIECSPYNSIIVTAAAPRLPETLLDQMDDPGRMVIPIGSIDEQKLHIVVKKDGQYDVEDVVACRFVPLIGDGAWPSDD